MRKIFKRLYRSRRRYLWCTPIWTVCFIAYISTHMFWEAPSSAISVIHIGIFVGVAALISVLLVLLFFVVKELIFPETRFGYETTPISLILLSFLAPTTLDVPLDFLISFEPYKFVFALAILDQVFLRSLLLNGAWIDSWTKKESRRTTAFKTSLPVDYAFAYFFPTPETEDLVIDPNLEDVTWADKEHRVISLIEWIEPGAFLEEHATKIDLQPYKRAAWRFEAVHGRGEYGTSGTRSIELIIRRGYVHIKIETVMQNCPWRMHLLELLDDTVGRVYDDKLRELEDIYNDMVLDYPNPS